MNLIIIFNILAAVAFPDEVAVMPNTCAELLPEFSQYMGFLEQTGDMLAVGNPQKAKKVYDVLAIRNLYQETSKNAINPVDGLIKDFLCDCYANNNGKIFTSDSTIIRSCLDKNIAKLIKDAKKGYIDMVVKKRADDRSIKLTEAIKDRISRLKNEAMIDMNRELNRKGF